MRIPKNHLEFRRISTNVMHYKESLGIIKNYKELQTKVPETSGGHHRHAHQWSPFLQQKTIRKQRSLPLTQGLYQQKMEHSRTHLEIS